MSGKAEILKMIEGRIETIGKLTDECVELIYKAAYNEAIEDCVTKSADPWAIYEMRKLKKE